MPTVALHAVATMLRALLAREPSDDPARPVQVEPSEVRYVAARHAETVVRRRPWVPMRRVATVSRGTVLAVRGQVPSRDEAGCGGAPWYAVWPFGYVCSRHVRPSAKPPPVAPALQVPEGRRLPFRYVMVRRDDVPQYDDEEGARSGTPARNLTRGMTLAVVRLRTLEGQRFIEDVDGHLTPREGVGWMGEGSSWQGVMLDMREPGLLGPVFAWTRASPTRVHAEPNPASPVVAKVPRRTAVGLGRPSGELPTSKNPAWWRIRDADTGAVMGWTRAKELSEVHIISPPESVRGAERLAEGLDQWIDVDLGEQVLVAYRGATPVYATLVSSGRGSPTPRGNYPVWAKVAAMHMANQAYEDRPYLVQNVPWVILFQGHNSLHAAYWHDRFGRRKSHGCVNLAPSDARWIFEWLGPGLPAGFTGYLPELGRAPLIHVRDSSRAPGRQFVQERSPGPPDREEEARRAEEAERRRAETLAGQGLAPRLAPPPAPWQRAAPSPPGSPAPAAGEPAAAPSPSPSPVPGASPSSPAPGATPAAAPPDPPAAGRRRRL